MNMVMLSLIINKYLLNEFFYINEMNQLMKVLDLYLSLYIWKFIEME